MSSNLGGGSLGREGRLRVFKDGAGALVFLAECSCCPWRHRASTRVEARREWAEHEVTTGHADGVAYRSKLDAQVSLLRVISEPVNADA